MPLFDTFTITRKKKKKERNGIGAKRLKNANKSKHTRKPRLHAFRGKRTVCVCVCVCDTLKPQKTEAEPELQPNGIAKMRFALFSAQNRTFFGELLDIHPAHIQLPALSARLVLSHTIFNCLRAFASHLLFFFFSRFFFCWCEQHTTECRLSIVSEFFFGK